MWRRPYVFDTALALLLAIGTIGSFGQEQLARPWWFVALLGALTALPLAVRRRWPLQVFAVTLGAHVVLNATGVETAAPGVAVATYTLAAYCERRTALRAGLAGLALFVPTYVYASGGSVVPATIFLAAAWLLGAYLRTRRAYLRELEEKADRLEREREENERRAVAEEQARIARELHDVIAHNVSVMTVQAAGAREVFETNPVRAREALAAIETTGREALAELRRLLGNDSASLAPQPGLERLDALVDQVRATGLPVELQVEGEPAELPAGVDVSAYRVVQEALTNTLKHASAQRAWVFVRYGEEGVAIEVLDDGVASPAPQPDGRGLVGMQERVALFGGELRTGARPEGGFRVWARFP